MKLLQDGEKTQPIHASATTTSVNQIAKAEVKLTLKSTNPTMERRTDTTTSVNQVTANNV